MPRFTIQPGRVATVRGVETPFGPGDEAALTKATNPGRLAVLEAAGIIEYEDTDDAPEGSRAAARVKLRRRFGSRAEAQSSKTRSVVRKSGARKSGARKSATKATGTTRARTRAASTAPTGTSGEAAEA